MRLRVSQPHPAQRGHGYLKGAAGGRGCLLLLLAALACCLGVLNLRDASSARPSHSDGTVSGLLVGIITVQRPDGASYINETLASLHDQKGTLAEHFGGVDVLVVEVVGSKDKPVVRTLSEGVFFMSVPEPHVPMATGEGRWRSMTQADIRLNIHVSAYMEKVSQRCRAAGLRRVLLLEDDFVWCDIGATTLVHVMRALDRQYQTASANAPSAFRFSYGMNGVIMECNDIGSVASYIKSEAMTGPVDVIAAEYWTKKHVSGAKHFGDRRYFVSRYNLLKHIGKVSTFGTADKRPSLRHPQCFDLLVSSGFSIPDENFNLADCQRELVWPCDWITKQQDRSDLASTLGLGPRSALKPKLDDMSSVDQGHAVATFVTSKPGDSCVQACATQGKTCDVALLSMVNRCEELRAFVPCTHCGVGTISMNIHLLSVAPGKFQSTLQDSVSQYRGQGLASTFCDISSRSTSLSCAAHEPGYQRLCGCW